MYFLKAIKLLPSSTQSKTAGSNDPSALQTEVDLSLTECPSVHVTPTWSFNLYPSVFMPFRFPWPTNVGGLVQTTVKQN